jgi:hypothetical protein
MFILRRVTRPALLLSLGLAASAQGATRTYIVTDYDTLRVDAPISVSVQTKRGATARAEGDADMLQRIDLSVSARVLTVRLKPSPFEGRRNDGRTATSTRLFLTVPALRRVQLSGAGSLAIEGMAAQRAEIAAAGSGALRVNGLAGDNVAVLQQGSGAVSLAGRAGKATVQFSGSGAIDAGALVTADLEVTAEGSGVVKAQATRAAKIVATGPASVTVEGKAACTVRHVGSGSVTCGGESF